MLVGVCLAMVNSDSRLMHVSAEMPGITRRRSGKGWCYFDPKGKRITDRAEIDRLNAVALPPAYQDAWFCPSADGHILATGIDARGRKQYRYHPDFRSQRDNRKFDGCAAFGRLLPGLRQQVEKDLSGSDLGRDRAVASVVRLLDLGFVRVGNELYAKQNKSFGATTLRRRHASLDGRKLRLRYKAKSGKLQEVELADRKLLQFVRKVEDLPGQHLFQYLDEEGEPHPVGSCDVNAYLHEVMGEEFTAKNFRTWHASEIAFSALAHSERQLSITAVTEIVAERLGNTPAIARKSYIHPAVLALIDRQGKWRDSLQLPRATKWMSAEERGLLQLLDVASAGGGCVTALRKGA